jgi:hypothetical protein
MKPDQKTVAIGAFSGVTLMVFSVGALYTALPVPVGIVSVIDQVVFALQVNVIAVLPLFLMLITIGNERFLSDAIDPTAHAEHKQIEIDGRVAENTLQQTFVFCILTLALSTLLLPNQMHLIVAVTIVHVIARLAFWIGYRRHPLYRAPGMAATAYLNLALMLSIVYLLVQ